MNFKFVENKWTMTPNKKNIYTVTTKNMTFDIPDYTKTFWYKNPKIKYFKDNPVPCVLPWGGFSTHHSCNILTGEWIRYDSDKAIYREEELFTTNVRKTVESQLDAFERRHLDKMVDDVESRVNRLDAYMEKIKQGALSEFINTLNKLNWERM